MEIIYTHSDLEKIIGEKVKNIFNGDVYIIFKQDGEKTTCFVTDEIDKITEIKKEILSEKSEAKQEIKRNIEIPPEHQHLQEFNNHKDKKTNIPNSNRDNRPMPISLSKM